MSRGRNRPPWAWRLVVRAALFLLRDLLGWQVQAARPDVRPPPDQPLVVVFNHTSNVDAFLVVDTTWRGLRHWCQPLVKAELFEVPGLGRLARSAGAIPVTRSEDTARELAYGAAAERLHEGGTILVAPEGTITHDGRLLPLRHGAARLALEARVDVLVVTHFGAQRGFSPVVRFPERDVLVTMRFDLLHPWPDEDAAALTGRIAATMLDRTEELGATYPQADPCARWWPPYARPPSPTATARDNLERYRQSMAEAVAHARERMANLAEDRELPQRLDEARTRMAHFAAEHELPQRLEDAREQARVATEELAERSRERAEELREQARRRIADAAAEVRERHGRARDN